MVLARGTRLPRTFGAALGNMVESVEWENCTRGSNPLWLPGEKDATDATTLGYAFPIMFPVLVLRLNDGTLVELTEARQRMVGSTRGDWSCSDILIKRSTDNGRTWSANKSLIHEANFVLPASDATSAGGVFLNLTGAVVHEPTGNCFLLWTRHYTVGTDTQYRALIAAKSTDGFATLTKLDGSALSGTLQGTDITWTDAATACIVVGDQPTGHGFTFPDTATSPPNLTGSVSSATGGGGTDIVITSTAHGLENGMKVRHAGGTNFDGDWIVEAKTANTYELAGSSSNPAASGTGTWKVMTRWFAGRPAAGVYDAATGWMLVGCHHRFFLSPGGDIGDGAWPYFIGSGDGGLTWKIRGAPAPSQAANAEMIEPTTIVRNDGTLYAAMRHRVSPAATKYYTTSSDGGATWSNAAAITGTNGPEAPCGLVAMGSQIVAVFAAHPNNTDRFLLAVAVSTDGGLTFGTARHLDYGWCGYPVAVKLDNSTFGLVYAAGNQSRDKILTGGAGYRVKYNQEVRWLRVNLVWLLRTTNADNCSRWEFTEAGLTALGGGVSGKRVMPGGSIFDWALQHQVMLGGNDADATPDNTFPTYSHTIGDPDETGLVFTSTSSLTIAEADLQHGVTPEANESFTWVWRGLFNFAGAATMFANKESASGIGIILRHTAGGKAEAVISDDGTGTNTVTSTTTVTSATALHTVVVERDVAAGKLRIYVDNETVEHEIALTETGALRNATLDFVANRYPGGTGSLDGHSVTLFEVHRSAKVAAGGYLLPTATVPAKSLPGVDKLGYSNPFANSGIITTAPYLVANDGANLLAWFNAVFDRGYHMRAGGSIDGAGRPPKAFAGLNAHTCWDASPAGRFARGSHGDGSIAAIRYLEDTIGVTSFPWWYHVKPASGASNWQVYNSAAAYDAIQVTGQFCLAGCFLFPALPTPSHYCLYDNSGGVATNGVFVAFQTSGQLYLAIKNGTATFTRNLGTHWDRVSDAADLPNIAALTRYFYCIRGQGTGQPVKLTIKVLTEAGVIGDADRYVSTANLTAAAGASTANLFIGISSASTFIADVQQRGPIIMDIGAADVSDAEVQSLYDFFLVEAAFLG